jgi:hypothetical protein
MREAHGSVSSILASLNPPGVPTRSGCALAAGMPARLQHPHAWSGRLYHLEAACGIRTGTQAARSSSCSCSTSPFSRCTTSSTGQLEPKSSTLPPMEEEAVACQMAMLTSQLARMPRRNACRQHKH